MRTRQPKLKVTKKMDKSSKTDAPKDSSKAGQAVGLNLVDLSQELNRTEHNFHKSRDTQGVLGSSYDWMKNNLGGSYETGSWIGRRWSNVLNYDMGSEAIQKNIDRTKQLVASGDTDKIARASEIADGRINLKATNTAKEYNNDQRLAVNLLADTATFAAVTLTRGKGGRDILELAVRGAVVKSGLKAVDGSYSKPLDDAATGAFIGVMTPLAGALGRGTGMVAETAPAIRALSTTTQSRAVSAVRFGTEGAALGHTQQISSLFEQKRLDGERAGQAFWKANLDSIANPTGAALGFAGGALGGFLFGKIAKSEVPNKPRPPFEQEVALEIPKSPGGTPVGPFEPSPGRHPKGPIDGGGSAAVGAGKAVSDLPSKDMVAVTGENGKVIARNGLVPTDVVPTGRKVGAALSIQEKSSPAFESRSPLSPAGNSIESGSISQSLKIESKPPETIVAGDTASGVNVRTKVTDEVASNAVDGQTMRSILAQLRGPLPSAIEQRVSIKALWNSVYPEYSVPNYQKFYSALRSQEAEVIDFGPFGTIRSVADGDKKLQSMNLKWHTKESLTGENLQTDKVVFGDGTELVKEKVFLPHMSKSSVVREILPTERPDLKFIKMVEIDDSFRLTKIDENTTLFHNLSTNVANVYRRDHIKSLVWAVKEGTNPKSVREITLSGLTGKEIIFTRLKGDFDPALLQKTAEGRPLLPYLEKEGIVKDVAPSPSSSHGKLKMLPHDEFELQKKFYEENASRFPITRWSSDCNELVMKDASGQTRNFFIPTANFIETADTAALYSILGNNRRALRELTQTPTLTKGSIERGVVSEPIFDEKAIRLSFSGQYETSLAKDKSMYFARTGYMSSSLADLEKAVKTAINYAKSKDGTVLVVDSTKRAQGTEQIKQMLPGYTSGAEKRLGGISEEVYEDLQEYVAGKHLAIVKPEALKANITRSHDREFRQLFIDEFAAHEVLARAFAAGKKMELTETSSSFIKQVEANRVLADKAYKEERYRESGQRRSLAPRLKSLPIPGSGRN